MGELYVYDPIGSLVKFGQVTDRLIQPETPCKRRLRPIWTCTYPRRSCCSERVVGAWKRLVAFNEVVAHLRQFLRRSASIVARILGQWSAAHAMATRAPRRRTSAGMSCLASHSTSQPSPVYS